MSDLIPALLSIVAFPIVFIGMWSLVCVLLGAFSGWQRLAKRYGTDAEAPGNDEGWCSGRLGLVSYRNTLVPAATPAGLDLRTPLMFRPGHPPLCIPWDHIAEEGDAFGLIIPMVKLRLGPDGPRLVLTRSTWEQLKARRG
ncbi:MAG: hypothetical protein H6742_13645 [Alphaproteobacteria bacterium]|nr:hypothetical protein [Alphaproteobacteria bacterium]